MAKTSEASPPAETSVEYYRNYFASHPDILTSKLKYNPRQEADLNSLIGRLSGNPSTKQGASTFDFSRPGDSSGRKLTVVNHGDIHELRARGPREEHLGKTPDEELKTDFLKPFGEAAGDFREYMMRMFMFEPSAIEQGNYPAIARAFQIDERSPLLGFRQDEGLNKFFRLVGAAATYNFERVGDRSLFDLETNMPGKTTQRLRVSELPLFNNNGKRLYVVGRVANVGRKVSVEAT